MSGGGGVGREASGAVLPFTRPFHVFSAVSLCSPLYLFRSAPIDSLFLVSPGGAGGDWLGSHMIRWFDAIGFPVPSRRFLLLIARMCRRIWSQNGASLIRAIVSSVWIFNLYI